MKEHPVQQVGLPAHQLDRTLAYINTYLNQDIRLQHIADELRMSLYYFCRQFKQSMGISPYQYILQRRVELAKQLLKQRELSIANIALQCGFAHQSQMTYHFNQQTGMTPRAYQKQ
ncbi:MAG: helix-turn-helix transcriptional regulator [Cyanothece sp. SIO1E1]|nr:helix-turn-helix transcriptional regulator [Cyanothece sp. SIO1E1]